MYERLLMYTFLERKFHTNYDGDIHFPQKITIFENITKNTFFAIFLSKQARKEIKILKIAFEMFY